MKRAILAAVLISFAIGAAFWLWLRTAPLTAIVRGGDGPLTLVLLHGYGGTAENWQQFVGKIEPPGNARLIFPQGPLRGPGSGMRGWWWLDIHGHIPPGQQMADFSIANPDGIKVASQLVRNYLEDIEGPIVLGGFSQGAMVSGEIAFQTDRELAALVLLGGTTVNEPRGSTDSRVAAACRSSSHTAGRTACCRSPSPSGSRASSKPPG